MSFNFTNVIISLLLFALSVFAEPQKNLDILFQKSGEVIISKIDSLVPAGKTIRISTNNSDYQVLWLKNELTNRLQNKGYQITESTDKSAFLVSLNSWFSFIRYTPKKKFPFFSTKYLREISGSFGFNITAALGDIMISKNFEYSYSDLVKGDQINLIENPNIPFSTGTKKESGIIKRLVEPALVTAATITVIYLLYSLRSDS